ncbi:glycosyltransferase [Peribacillus sp. NPDC094092]|uniref:glycosyltransferase n=1 Tax=Peribacillus sp. NPDC094092 TaxID=3390611 RepID=UPI003CFF4AD9
MKNGVNLIGYARAESGLGEACRSAAKALQSVGVPFGIINFPRCPSRQTDLSWKHKEVKKPFYKTNIFFINADQLYHHYTLNILKREWFINRYNIGYWHWELPEFPDAWVKSFELINEIWVPSLFTLNSISSKTSKPVHFIPHAISVEVPEINRTHFSLPNNRFLFLTMFDLHSTTARKNPFAVIEAFKKAFPQNDPTAGLVIKINNASHFLNEVNLLKQSIIGFNNIFLIDKVLSRKEVNGLMYVTDSLVSLHRSEGFGLPLAEAMYLGKPVIATNWSGNVDFMNENNSCLVDFTLKNIDGNYGPYTTDQKWAEPHIDRAAYFMKKVVDDKSFTSRIGMLAKRTIKLKYSPQFIGGIYKTRLNQNE